ncbi:MAG: hypothetical protein KA712_01965 [Myxococcales bacterium]|nr:hypothetical protein [Myxococcales bacterium]
MTVTIDVSPGELIDKITILEIKAERITDPETRDRVCFELGLLEARRRQAVPPSPDLEHAADELRKVNATLWDIEDQLRDCERACEFGERFVSLARAVYRTNDRRAALKKRINTLLGSAIDEVKAYKPY